MEVRLLADVNVGAPNLLDGEYLTSPYWNSAVGATLLEFPTVTAFQDWVGARVAAGTNRSSYEAAITTLNGATLRWGGARSGPFSTAVYRSGSRAWRVADGMVYNRSSNTATTTTVNTVCGLIEVPAVSALAGASYIKIVGTFAIVPPANAGGSPLTYDHRTQFAYDSAESTDIYVVAQDNHEGNVPIETGSYGSVIGGPVITTTVQASGNSVSHMPFVIIARALTTAFNIRIHCAGRTQNTSVNIAYKTRFDTYISTVSELTELEEYT